MRAPVSSPPPLPTLSSVPPPPRQPSRRARRVIYKYTGSQFVLLLVGVIFLIVGVGLAVPFCWGIPSEIAISLSKRVVAGRVLRTGRAGYTVNDETPTRIWYRYEVDGRAYEASSDTLDAAGLGLAGPELAQSEVRVEAASFHPAFSRIAGASGSFFGYFGLFTLIFPILGGALTFFAVRSNRREIFAYVNGVPATARVVFVGDDTSTTINGRHPMKIEWEFRVGSEVYSGSISSMRVLELEEFLEAKEVVVLHDPERPEINTLFVA
jgi:hypothetical protein